MSYVSIGQLAVRTDAAPTTMVAAERVTSTLAPSLTLAPASPTSVTSVSFTPLAPARPTCATEAEKKQAAIDCKIADVKGLGFHYSAYNNPKFAGMDACAVAQLPTCGLVRASAFVVPTPAPTPTRTTVATPPPLRISTAMTSAFQPTAPAPVPPPPAPATKKFAGLGVGGLLAVLAVGGGAAYYLLRKKKAAKS